MAAAIPAYLPADVLDEASPGLRFGFYLNPWKRDYEKVEADALRQVLRLTRADVARTRALASRQDAVAEALGEGRVFLRQARSTAPFVTGLGQAHPLENGFAFLAPYGLPYLPGSGVKGVLRQAARELASGAWGDDARGWDEAALRALFGSEDSEDPCRGALSFWDVIPQPGGRPLMLEILTPHQSHYHQRGESPHESGQPVPNLFLTVPPGTAFGFTVTCDPLLLGRRAPALAGAWRALLEAAFDHAFDWLGFGAKTAVGYGAMQLDPVWEREEKQRREEEAARAEQRAQQQANEQEALRKKAEYEALPEHVKRLCDLEDMVDRFNRQKHFDKNDFDKLAGTIDALARALENAGTEERLQGAATIEGVFERFGWARAGLKSEKRKKKTAQHKALIARLRGEPDTPA